MNTMKAFSDVGGRLPVLLLALMKLNHRYSSMTVPRTKIDTPVFV